MARYENFIVENKVSEMLETMLDMSQFLTVDTSLAEAEGMQKIVHKYTVTGGAQTVAEGEGNTEALSVGYTPVTHKVTTSQVKFEYTDEADMADSYYVDKGVEAIAKAIVNEYNAKAIAEFEKTSNNIQATAADEDAFADAIARLNLEDTEENGFFALVNPKTKAAIRKALGDELKYVEAFARTGYVGSVCGIPVYTSRKVSDNKIIIANKEAVTCFMKKSAEVEQERDGNTRTNTIFGRNVKVIALTDESKCVTITLGA